MRLLPLALLLIAASANAQQLGFKGVPLGADRSALLSAFPAIQCKALRVMASADEHCQTQDSFLRGNLETFANQPLRGIQFFTVAAKFEGFEAIFPWTSYGSMRDALQAEYGLGVEASQIIETGGGRAITSRIWKLTSPTGNILLFERGAGAIDQGSVEVSSPALRDWRQARAKPKKDL